MSDGITSLIVQRIHQTHQWLLDVTSELTEEELVWVPSHTAPPVRWHFWHISRWADRLQASFLADVAEYGQQPDPNKGIWQVEGLAASWGLDPDTLGWLETGAGLDDDVASSLPLPVKSELFGYGQRAFSAADQAVASLDTHQFQEPRQSILEGREGTVSSDILFHLSHASRHLGMIEALRGVQGLRGTATI